MAKDIFIDTKQIDKLSSELKGFEKEVKSATRLALNRTINHVITKAGQTVSKLYAVKSTEVKATFKGGIKKPTNNDLSTRVLSVGHTLSIAHFPHNPNNPLLAKMIAIRYNNSKIKVKIKKSEGYKVINGNPGAFIASTGAKSDSGVQFNVFKRVGKARLPIKVIRTLSIPQMITNEVVASQVQEAATQKLSERFEHEIDRKMATMKSKIGGK